MHQTPLKLLQAPLLVFQGDTFEAPTFVRGSVRAAVFPEFKLEVHRLQVVELSSAPGFTQPGLFGGPVPDPGLESPIGDGAYSSGERASSQNDAMWNPARQAEGAFTAVTA